MKRQKLYIVIASIVLASVCTGCKKVDNEPVSSYSMTVDAVKTKTLSDSGSAISSTWTAGDVVTVWSADGTTTQYGTLTAGSGGSSTTLSGTLDSAPANGETLLLKYLSPDYANQDGTLTGSAASIDKLCDYATATVTAMVSGNSVTTTGAAFESQQAILKLTIKNSSGTDITSSVTSLRITDGAAVYRVTPSSSLNSIYVALPPVGSNQVIGFMAVTANGNYRKSLTGKTLAAGILTPVTLQTLYEGALPGLFTINSSGDQVRFSQGNLQAVFESAGTSCIWKFADNQWNYVGNAVANNSINASGSVSDAGAVDLFGWNGASSSEDNYGINNSVTPSDYGSTSGEGLKHDWGHNSIYGGGNAADVWYTPVRSELEYIISSRDASTINGTANARFARARINSVRGLLLFPDSFALPSSITLENVNDASSTANYGDNAFSNDNWALLEDAGVVFLPAAGYREGNTISKADEYGRYWTQTNGGAKSVSVYFTGSTVAAANGFSRHYGAAVRLVQNAN